MRSRRVAAVGKAVNWKFFESYCKMVGQTKLSHVSRHSRATGNLNRCLADRQAVWKSAALRQSVTPSKSAAPSKFPFINWITFDAALLHLRYQCVARLSAEKFRSMMYRCVGILCWLTVCVRFCECARVCVLLARHQITFVCKSAAFLQTFFLPSSQPHGGSSNISSHLPSPPTSCSPPSV